jgi:flavin-dependent dehydrogenase
MKTFVDKCRDAKLTPPGLRISNPDYALDPAGAIHKMDTLTKNRTILIGDAAGFVSGSTGEGIYPGISPVRLEKGTGVGKAASLSSSASYSHH